MPTTLYINDYEDVVAITKKLFGSQDSAKTVRFHKISTPGNNCKQIGIKGKMLHLLKNYLSERYQRVVLNEQTS